MSKERWAKIKDLPDEFEISDQGRVRNISNPDNIQYGRTRISNHGYPTISIRGKQFAIHRLVAQAFVENPDPDKFNTVRHLDRDKLNNNASNLEWISATKAAKFGLKAKLDGVDRIYCEELDIVFRTLLTAAFYTTVPERLITHGIKNNCKVCGLTFVSIQTDDARIKDKKDYYIEITDAIKISSEANSISEFQFKIAEFLKDK